MMAYPLLELAQQTSIWIAYMVSISSSILGGFLLLGTVRTDRKMHEDITAAEENIEDADEMSTTLVSTAAMSHASEMFYNPDIRQEIISAPPHPLGVPLLSPFMGAVSDAEVSVCDLMNSPIAIPPMMEAPTEPDQDPTLTAIIESEELDDDLPVFQFSRDPVFVGKSQEKPQQEREIPITAEIEHGKIDVKSRSVIPIEDETAVEGKARHVESIGVRNASEENERDRSKIAEQESKAHPTPSVNASEKQTENEENNEVSSSGETPCEIEETESHSENGQAK